MNTRQAFQKVSTLIGHDPKPKVAAITDPISLLETRTPFTLGLTPWTTQRNVRQYWIPSPSLSQHTLLPLLWRMYASSWWYPSMSAEGVCHRALSHHSLPFLESYRTVSVTTVWKTSTIILVPKKPHLSKPNHYRSVALTYQHHPPNCQTTLESKPVHKVKRGAEDAVACLLHPLLLHPKSPGNFTRLLLIDFCSAFSTIQCYQMTRKLTWTSHNFSSTRYTISSVIDQNTRAP